jgi:hypothetical protein
MGLPADCEVGHRPPDRDTVFGAVLEPVGAHADQPLKLKAAAVHRVLTTDGQFEEIFMLGYSHWQLLKGLAVVVGTISIVSLALIYFIPSPPSTVTMATVRVPTKSPGHSEMMSPGVPI